SSPTGSSWPQPHASLIEHSPCCPHSLRPDPRRQGRRCRSSGTAPPRCRSRSAASPPTSAGPSTPAGRGCRTPAGPVGGPPPARSHAGRPHAPTPWTAPSPERPPGRRPAPPRGPGAARSPTGWRPRGCGTAPPPGPSPLPRSTRGIHPCYSSSQGDDSSETRWNRGWAMLMNKAETALVNSPPRRWLQRFYETQVLLRFGGRVAPGARALEIGCGSGYGTQLVLERFGAGIVDAVDLDPAMIQRAGRRLVRYGDRVRLAQGSATDLRAALDAENGGYDA